jgi:hypothetical protein
MTWTYQKTIAALALAALMLPAAAKQEEGKSFAIKPPAYTIKPSVKHAEHRKAKAIQWTKKHLTSKDLKWSEF